ncbi:hypothetical protein, partial [Enterocloster sp.]|uniref:hypothetical protein n=1 Tax=Enterocloster sp. TaxID=2719315 RepID=UPI003890F942
KGKMGLQAALFFPSGRSCKEISGQPVSDLYAGSAFNGFEKAQLEIKILDIAFSWWYIMHKRCININFWPNKSGKDHGGCYEFKGKKFFDIERLYTGGNPVSAGSGGRIKGQEEKRDSYGYLKGKKCGADL